LVETVKQIENGICLGGSGVITRRGIDIDFFPSAGKIPSDLSLIDVILHVALLCWRHNRALKPRRARD
jgi:hypothetical protein